MDINKLKDKLKINPIEVFRQISNMLNRKRGIILFSVFLIILGYSGYLWYRYIANPNWSDLRRQEYISTKQNDVTFARDKFDEIVKEIDSRKINYQKNLENIPDIFRLK